FCEERTLESLQAKSGLLERLLEPIAQLDCVREVRQRGFMVAIELEGFDPPLRTGHQLALEARARGAIIRPLGDVIVLMPPRSTRATSRWTGIVCCSCSVTTYFLRRTRPCSCFAFPTCSSSSERVIASSVVGPLVSRPTVPIVPLPLVAGLASAAESA